MHGAELLSEARSCQSRHERKASTKHGKLQQCKSSHLLLVIHQQRGLVPERPYRAELVDGSSVMPSSAGNSSYGVLKSMVPEPPCPVTLVFLNRAGTTLRLKWAGFDGELKQYGTLPPGSEHTQPTHRTHVWLLEDEFGVVFGIYVCASALSLDYVGLLEHWSCSLARSMRDNCSVLMLSVFCSSLQKLSSVQRVSVGLSVSCA